MFREKLHSHLIECLKANRIYDYIEESAEEFDPSREYLSFADHIYDKIAANFDIENNESVQNVALGICDEAIKTLLLGLANQTTERPVERIDALLESELGIKKPEQK